MKDLNEQVDFLVQRLANDPDSLLFARLADLYLKMDRVEEAIQLCEEGIKKHPYYVTGHLVLGKSYLANKMYDQAEKEFKRVLLFDPKCLAAHKLYGDLMQEIGWENTCEMSYKKILQIDPLDEVARTRVGEYILKGESAHDETDYLAPHSVTSDLDVEAMSPISETGEEEDLLFMSEEAAAKSPAPEIDETKEEEFSSILDDIFKDEVVQEEPSSESAEPADSTATEPDLVSEIQKDPQSYFSEKEPAEPESEVKENEIEPLPFEAFGNDFEPGPSGSETNRLQFSGEEGAAGTEEMQKQTSVESPKKKPKSEKIVTPTLGEIYAAQGQYAKAIDVFELLLKKHPDNESFAYKIEVLKQKLEDAKNAPKN